MRKILMTALLLAAAFSAGAQRTAKDEMFLKVNYIYPFSSPLGVSVGWGMYKISGFWDTEAAACRRRYTIDGCDGRLETTALEARGGYMARLFCKRDRSINLYVGGGGILGCREMKGDEAFKVINEKAGTEYSGTLYPFEFGFYPKVEAEFFFSGSIALDVGALLPVTFFGEDYNTLQKLTGVIHYEVFAGLKFNF